MTALSDSGWGWVGVAIALVGAWLWLYYGVRFKVANRTHRKAIHIVFGTIALVGIAGHGLYHHNKLVAKRLEQHTQKVAAENERRKRELVRMELSYMYQEVNELLHAIPADAAPETFQAHLANCKKWFFSRQAWIRENIGEAARTKFLDTVGPQITIPAETNKEQLVLRTILARIKWNLEDLMKDDTWASVP